jgi:hypothetical protein
MENSEQPNIKHLNNFINKGCTKITSFEKLVNAFSSESYFDVVLFNFLNDLVLKNNLSPKLVENLKDTIFNNLLTEDEISSNFTDFILEFYVELSNNPKVFHSKTQAINNFLNNMKAFKDLNLLTITKSIQLKALEKFPSVNSFLIPRFAEKFELIEYFKQDKSLLLEHTNNLIKTKKQYENIFIYIDIFGIKDDIDHKQLLQTCLEDKNKFNFISKICKAYPEHITRIIEFYCSKNDTKHASLLAKQYSEFIGEGTLRDIILQAKCKSMHYHFKRYLEYETDIQILFEMYKDESEVLGKLANKFCNNYMFKECYFILKKFGFKSIELGEYEIEYLKEYLTTNFGKPGKLAGKQKGGKDYIPDQNMYLFSLYANEKELNNVGLKDAYGPYNKKCMKLSLPLEKILFLDNEKDLYILDEFKSSQYVGIDLEWRSQSSTLEDVEHASIFQLAVEEFVLIIDYGKLKDNQYFVEKFMNVFTDKTFIAFGFKNDLQMVKDGLKQFMVQLKTVDLVNLYKNKFLEDDKNTPSLSELCRLTFGKELCKFEQMSNWDVRPLRLRQVHYAALDAHVLLKLHKEFTKVNV